MSKLHIPHIILKTWYDTYRQRETPEASKAAEMKFIAAFGSMENAKAHLKQRGIL